MSRAYYNEIDPYAAEWLRNLIAAGHIAPGDVDERSIVDVQPDDLRGYTQCHFFAGIGGWSLALRLAGWPDGRPVWTGSCPCQPFSSAGKGREHADERHLWPAWFRLISECSPRVVFGEQVASALGRAWLDHVCADLESRGYAAAAAIVPACAVGAPHIRERLWFVADRAEPGRYEQPLGDGRTNRRPASELGRLRDAGRVADADEVDTRIGRAAGGAEVARIQPGVDAHGCRLLGDVGDAASVRRDGLQEREFSGAEEERRLLELARASPWSDLEWLACSDGKTRPTEPGLFPLAYGIPGRVGRLRAYGNAIVAQVAAEFIAAYCEITNNEEEPCSQNYSTN